MGRLDAGSYRKAMAAYAIFAAALTRGSCCTGIMIVHTILDSALR